VTIPLPIETERLVIRHVCIGVLDREGTAALLDEYRRAQDEHGFSSWALTERESGTIVGDVGFGIYRPTGEPELGYTLAAAFWGRGYALEAARACVAAAFANLPSARLVAKIRPENERSLQLAERLGMRTVEEIAVDGHAHLLLALERT
jgi:RimJ/RimL family protein N-acetyltransferase